MSHYAKIIRTAAFGCIFLAIQRRVVAFAPHRQRPSFLSRSRSVGASSQIFLDRRRRHVGIETFQDYRSSAHERKGKPTRTVTAYHQSDGGENSAFAIDSFDSTELFEDFNEYNNGDTLVVHADPSRIGFVFPEAPARSDPLVEAQTAAPLLKASPGSSSYYPFAAMLQGSAPYIAGHTNKVIVFHIPGEILEDTKASDALLQDIAFCWLLDMKIVIVAGCRLAKTEECALEQCSMEYSHECHNALKVTDRATLRTVEEEAGYLRTEMERKLNRCLRAHGGTSASDDPRAAAPNGNVVSGNFYTAKRFGEIRGEDFQYTGFATETYTENILQVLQNDDVVLLSTVGLSPMGELVNVNGYHLAATVAASLKASKLIYLSNQSCLLQLLSSSDEDHHQRKHQPIIQELPMSLAQSIIQYHKVKCHNTGFATFQKAQRSLPPAAVELLLHLGWAAWAVERGVGRSHIVNPGDGALLEELFTAKNGANTCLFHDRELESCLNGQSSDGDIDLEDFDEFFASAVEDDQRISFFG